MTSTAQECARELLDVMPLIMWSVRAGMRAHGRLGLSVPQFGALIYLRRREGASLSDVAGHMGLTLPSASKLIDGLVLRGIVARQTDRQDRRRVTLTFTAEGRHAVHAARDAALGELAAALAAMPASERATVAQAMRALRAVFAPERVPLAPGRSDGARGGRPEGRPAEVSR